MKAFKILMVAAMAAVMATGAWAQDKKSKISLEAARQQIAQAATDPSKMAELMGMLSAEDQITFLGDVNAAIEGFDASAAEKTAMFVETNRAALQSAEPGNLRNLVAEVFATVPTASLTAINETFGTELFNRATDPSVTYRDEQFVQIAQGIVDKVQERTAGSEDAAVRTTFAVLMMVTASNGTPANLAETLTEGYTDEQAKNLARNEWIPAATGANQEKTYEPMLGGSMDLGGTPDDNVTVDLTVPLRVSTPQTMDAMLSDIVSEVGNGGLLSNDYTDTLRAKFDDPGAIAELVESEPLTPGFMIEDENGNLVPAPWDPTVPRGSGTPMSEDTVVEPTGYQNQTTNG